MVQGVSKAARGGLEEAREPRNRSVQNLVLDGYLWGGGAEAPGFADGTQQR